MIDAAPMTGLDALDLDELERVARGATPGPWRTLVSYCALHRVGLPGADGLIVADVDEAEDALYIATFDPPTVLRMIARIRELEAEGAGRGGGGKRSDIPDFDALRGLAPDATGEMASEDFVRTIRDEW